MTTLTSALPMNLRSHHPKVNSLEREPDTWSLRFAKCENFPASSVSKSLIALFSLATLLTRAEAQQTALTVIELASHPKIPLAYDKTELQIKAGARVSLKLSNTDLITAQPHNFVLVKPGKLEAVSALATAMITDPKALEKNYIPEQRNDILAFTPLVPPGESVTIEFIAPEEPGDYPFLCTFPGHALQMRGVLHVNL